MQILNLPLEVLSCIVGCLRAHHLAHLIEIGNKELTNRLTQRGAVTFFWYEFSPFRELVWPSLVSQFPHLTSFKVSCDVDQSFKSCDLTKLPSTLRHIDLDFMNDSELFYNLDFDVLFPQLESIKTRGLVMDNLDLIFSAFLRLENIQSLNLVMDNAFAGYIPKTLTSLDLISIDFEVRDNWYFPDSLTHLKLHIQFFHENQFRALRPALRFLEIRYGDPVANKNFFELPKGLTNLTHLDLTIEECDLTLDLIKAIPPHLTHLCLHGPTTSSPELIKKLPPTLLTTDVILEVSPEIASSLPSQIVSLRKAWVSCEALPVLPATIKSFGTMVSPNDIQNFTYAFPPHLTVLTVDRLPSGFDYTFPPSLTTLTLTDSSALEDVGHCCPPLPDSLLHLYTRHHTLYSSMRTFEPDDADDGDELPMLNNELMASLPRNLLSLDLRGFTVSSDISFDHLPPNLTHFTLLCDHLPFGAVHQMPKSLATLTLFLFDPLDNYSNHLIKSLPARLESFRYRILMPHADSGMTNDVLRYLPKSLTKLQLPHSSLLDRTSRALLRPSVIHFELE